MSSEPSVVKQSRRNFWYKNNSSETVFVFVHGLLSDCEQCWRSADGVFWPQLVHTDKEFRSPAIFLAGFYTALDAGDYSISDCANELHRGLRHNGDDERAVLDFNQIVFVCHSLGGVVCRRVLEEHYSDFENKTVGLVLMASPSQGSEYAARLKSIGGAFGSTVASQLIPNSEFLRDLDSRFRQMLQSKKQINLIGTEATEHHGPLRFRYLPFFRLPRIVDEGSSSKYFGAPTKLPGTDHFTIVKPTSVTHPSHLFLTQFFKEKLLRSGAKTPSALQLASGTPLQNVSVDPLFDIYAARHDAFYFARDLDRKTEAAFERNSAWLTGGTGVGKTSAIKRYLAKKNQRPIEVSLSQMKDEDVRSGLIREISETIALRTDRKSTPQSTREVIQYLANLDPSLQTVLFLDEVNLHNETFKASFTDTVVNLAEALNRESTSKRTIAICSIVAPAAEGMTEKAAELFVQLDCESWVPADILGLLALINNGLQPHQKLTVMQQQELMNEANGSPRFVKIALREAISQNRTCVTDELFRAALDRARSACAGLA